MKKYLRITFEVLTVIGLIFFFVVSQIQIGYADTEKQKATQMEKFAMENAKKAEVQAVIAQQVAAEAEYLKTELEKCKSGKK